MSFLSSVMRLFGYVSEKKFNKLQMEHRGLVSYKEQVEYDKKCIERNTRQKSTFKGGKVCNEDFRISMKGNTPYEVILNTGEFVKCDGFSTYEQAERKAKELAGLNPGETFHVFGPIAKAKAVFDIAVEKTIPDKTPGLEIPGDM